MRGAAFAENMVARFAEQKGRYSLMLFSLSMAMFFVTLVVALSSGVEARVSKILSVWGSRKCIIWPAVYGDTATPIPLADLQAVKSEFNSKAVVSGWCVQPLSVSYEDVHVQLQVTGVEPCYAEISGARVTQGVPLGDDDESALQRNCVLGSAVARRLFGEKPSVGKRILLDGVPFCVKGVNAPLGLTAVDSKANEYLWIPLSTFVKRLSQSDGVYAIHCMVRNGYSVDAVASEVQAFLANRHRSSVQGGAPFTAQVPSELIHNVKAGMRSAQVTASAIALVALLLAAALVISVLMTSVSQRSSEIGIKRALGATQLAIAVEVLSESSLLSVLGLGLGMMMGYGVVRLHPAFLAKLPMEFTALGTFYMLVVAAAFGVAVGIVPALRAARLDPVKALR
jgi:putative ABC transport system permease protein